MLINRKPVQKRGTGEKHRWLSLKGFGNALKKFYNIGCRPQKAIKLIWAGQDKTKAKYNYKHKGTLVVIVTAVLF